MWIELNTIEGKVLFCCCYRPPDKPGGPPPTRFWEQMSSAIDDIRSDGYRNICILGDLNADPKTRHGRLLHDLCTEQSMKTHISEPTRITSHSATVLDQIISNVPNFVRRVDVSVPVSSCDHCVVSAVLNFKIKKEKSYKRLVWQYNRANFAEFRNALAESNLDECLECNTIDESASMWTEKFLNIARTCIPNKVATIRPNDSPWYNNTLRRLKRIARRAFRILQRENNNANEANYKQADEVYHKELDVAEGNYRKSIASSLSNPDKGNKWHKNVKWLTGRGADTSYPSLNVNNELITDSKDKADNFNEYFLSHSNVDDSNTALPELNTLDSSLTNIIITEEEVSDQLSSIITSKSTGPDGITPKLLKEAGHTIVPSLTKLFNLSLSTGIYPSHWKLANVLPLFKKGVKDNIGNYRPVSLLSCVSKFFEKVIFKHVFNYIRDNNIISEHQSGFRPKDSTVHQLAYLYHKFAKALDCKLDVQIVFCDISKAFDKVWHKGLLFKLKQIGINGQLLEWFRSYLHERKQKVIIRGQESEYGNINAGVPQGSVLGPLLFLIYINDLVVNVTANIKLFADDTSLFIDFEDPNESEKILNADLRTIKEWAEQWIVTFSPPKTKSMTCSLKKTPPNVNLQFDTQQLDNIPTHKHLGLTLSNTLNWSSHINSVIESTSVMANALKQLKYIVDRKSLEHIYFTYMLPKLEYGCHIWDNCTSTDGSRLEQFQLCVARTVTGAKRGTSHAALYRETGWQKLSDRRHNIKMKIFAKMTTGNAPPYLCSLLPPKIGESRPNSRSADNYVTPKTRTELFKNSFIPSAIKSWNNTLHLDRSLKHFKDSLKLTHNFLYYIGARLVNISHAQ